MEKKDIIKALIDEIKKMNDEILTAKEAGEVLKMSETSVMNAYREGILNGYMIRNKVRFIKSEIFTNLKTWNDCNIKNFIKKI
jgi:di/tripeptidase